MVTNTAVVRNVGLREQRTVISNNSGGFVVGTTVNADKLTYDIAIANLCIGYVAIQEFLILTLYTDRDKGEDLAF